MNKNKLMQAFLPHLRGLPINGKALEQIQTLAERLPEAGMAGCLEMRLNDEDAADFCAILGPEDRVEAGRGKTSTGGGEIGSSLPTDWAKDTCWQRALAIRRAWMDDEHPLSDLYALCYEFDEGVPSPNLFYTLKKKPEDPAAGRRDTRAILEQVVRETGARAAPETFANYERCEKALTPGAYIRHVGLLLPRPTDAVRIVIADMAATDIMEYLRRLDLDVPGVGQVLERLPEFLGGIQVNLDVGPRIHPKVGLEITVPALEKSLSWPVIMARLHQDGLVSKEKFDALIPWYAMNSMYVDHKLFWRSLNHIKIVVRNIGLPEAKAYLMYHPSLPMGYLFHDILGAVRGKPPRAPIPTHE